MREFVVVAHEAPASPEFSLDDLPGTGGRMDLLARCVSSAVFTSHGIREARIHLVIGDEVTVRIDGSDARNLRPDERSTAARVRDALADRDEAIGHEPVGISPGVELVRFGLAETLQQVDGRICWLLGDGQPLAETRVPTDPVFVLSDHRPFTAADRAVLSERADERLRLGPTTIHADHAISVVHNWLDTDGYTDY